MRLGGVAPADDGMIGRALNRAQQASALTIVALAIVVLLVMQLDRPGHGFWAVALALVPMVLLQVARLSSPSDILSGAYLVFGGIAIFTIDLSKSVLATGELAEAGLGLFAIRLAVILCGAAGTSIATRVTWTALGYLTSEAAVVVASIALEEPYVYSIRMLLVAVVVALLHPLSALVNPSAETVWQRLREASLDDESARRREALEQRAVALVHDTVLGQLHAIAAAEPGALPRELRAPLARSVAAVTGDPAASTGLADGDAASTEWRQTPLFAAIQDARLQGLEVEVTGDPTEAGRLDGDTGLALGLAVAQCLTNVLKHSGVRRSEVAVYGTDSDVCVMVIDSGRGFDKHKTAADRLGLSTSVKRRIESVGGGVQVWATPGQGTSIMLRVPDARRASPAEIEGGSSHA